MAYSQNYQDRTQRTYRPPEIDTVDGLTYNRWGALGIVYGVNVPFVSKLAQGVFDEDNFRLWSSPTLVLTIAEAHDAWRNENATRHNELQAAAVEFCNRFLPEDQQLPPNSSFRLAWVEHGIASVTCELNRRDGVEMDVVKHGPATFILNAPKPTDDDVADRRMRTEYLFTATGEMRQPRPPRDNNQKRDPRSPLHPQRRAGNFGGRRGNLTT